MKWEYGEPETLHLDAPGLFILNEGNFQYGNATLSFYDPEARTVENEVFYRSNAMKLGDVAQSMTLHGGLGWIVVNRSRVIFAVDPVTFKEQGRIEGLTSPRYIHFIDEHKAYVSQLWDNRIFIVDPSAYKVTGYITVPGMEQQSGSTEQMVQLGRYVYCNCWSYQNSIIKIDTETDEVVASTTVGIQPESLVFDCRGKLWTLCDGGYEGSPYGYEAPSMHCIEPLTMTVERTLRLRSGDTPSQLQLNGAGDTLYWINRDIWRMPVDAKRLPVRPFLPYRDTRFYGLTIDPVSSEVYVADAIDYQQPGAIYRYSPQGDLIDEFTVGVNPGAFAWK